ncbi:MAG: iron chelate uptake ABC transporter family permease subunit, partial [Duncaniella sp.]|nr:iron chelate uptake ABC transporter family permease subunit [Duncaniella sp.]
MNALKLSLIAASILLLFALNLTLGSVEIAVADVVRVLAGNGSEANRVAETIVLRSRLPQALTAIMAGAGLAVSGLLMQTAFHNPLAGPSVLGISSGASLGVAFVVLLSGSVGGVALSRMGAVGSVAMTIAAICGALAIMGLIAFTASRVRGNVTLLIMGVMIGYIANA